MTRIYTPLVINQLDNSDIVQLYQCFGFNSDVIKKNKLKWLWRPPEPLNSMFPYQEGDVWFPIGFVFDFESVPRWFRGPTGVNKRGGTSHDGACRKGVKGDQACEFVCPGMTKSIAADLYFEMMEYTDSIDVERFKKENHPWIPKPVIVPVITFKDWFRRNLKSEFVRYWPGGFFQKFALDATCKEVAGMECDPYVTVAKLDALIVKTEAVSADLKDVSADTDAMVQKTDEVTAELKEVKAETIEANK